MKLGIPSQCYLAAGRVHGVSFSHNAINFTNHGRNPPQTQTAGPFSSPVYSSLDNKTPNSWGIVRAVYCSAGSGAPSPPQFSVYRVTGDGRCMFRALAQGSHLAALEESGSVSLNLLPIDQETAAADSLRQAICEELVRREQDFAPFIDLDEAGSFRAYIERMKKSHTWGGEPELAVAAHVLGRPVAVYMQQGPGGRLEHVSEYENEGATESVCNDSEKKALSAVPLLFHGAGHYDLLVKTPIVLNSKL